jgi:hypothetical protein
VLYSPAPRNIAAAHHRDVIDHANIIIPNSLLLMYLTADPGRFQRPVVLASKLEGPRSPHDTYSPTHPGRRNARRFDVRTQEVLHLQQNFAHCRSQRTQGTQRSVIPRSRSAFPPPPVPRFRPSPRRSPRCSPASSRPPSARRPANRGS